VRPTDIISLSPHQVRGKLIAPERKIELCGDAT